MLLTVGTQLPFDRLVKIVDGIAPSLDKAVYAQTGAGYYEPQNMVWERFLKAVEFESLIAHCEVIVSHAGVGSVLAAQRYKKPIILFPRRAALGEHRSDHQLSTVGALTGRSGIYVAHNEDQLVDLLRQDLAGPLVEEDRPGRKLLQVAVADFIRTMSVDTGS